LILSGFKGQAFEIISKLVLLLNGGRWKKVHKGKQFKDEYGNEEEAFNDFFRIGISVREGKVKLYEQFYKSDIIIGKLQYFLTFLSVSSRFEANYRIRWRQ